MKWDKSQVEGADRDTRQEEKERGWEEGGGEGKGRRDRGLDEQQTSAAYELDMRVGNRSSRVKSRWACLHDVHEARSFKEEMVDEPYVWEDEGTEERRSIFKGR